MHPIVARVKQLGRDHAMAVALVVALLIAAFAVLRSDLPTRLEMRAKLPHDANASDVWQADCEQTDGRWCCSYGDICEGEVAYSYCEGGDEVGRSSGCCITDF